MYMMQNIEKSRHKQLERKAREDRRRALSLQTGKSEEELRTKESQIAAARGTTASAAPAPAEPEAAPAPKEEPAAKPAKAPKKKTKVEEKSEDDVFDFDEEDDDLF